MAITQNTFTGNGSNLGPFSFTFKWLESTDIKVSVGGVLKTAGTHYNLQSLNYTTKTGGQVLFTAGNAPANGASIRIYRDTDDDALSAVFSSGSAIRAKDLNDNFTQNLYVTQETNNNALNVDGSNPMVGNLNMNGYQIDNLGEPTSDSDAATKKYIDDRYGNLSIPGFTRWSKTAVGGETTLSGVGTTGGTLGYSPNREQVYLNGAQLQRDADYTANNGTSIVLNVALLAGDVLEVICVNNLNTGTTAQAQDVYWNQSGSGAVTRTVESKLQDVVSVRDFGAVGDGISNDTSKVQAAVNAVGANGSIYFPKGVYYVTALTGADNVVFYGDGASFTGGYSRKIAQNGSISGDGQRQYDYLSCAIRNSGGTFAFIADSDHQPTGLQSVVHSDATTIQVNYKKTCKKVGTFLVAPDETLAPYGVTAGSSVGLSASYIKTAAPLGFTVSGTGVVTTTPLWSGSITATVASDAITILHPPVAHAEDPTSICIVGSSTAKELVYATYSIDQVTLRCMDQMNGYVYYNGSSWVWDQSFSTNVNAPTLTWTASNTLRVAHENVGDRYGISLTHHGSVGTIRSAVSTAGTNLFEIIFFDAAGAQITTPSTGMKVWYTRCAKVPSKLPSNLLVSVRRGHATVPIANYANIAAQNFWIIGTMENNT
jgi:hypothetical protein